MHASNGLTSGLIPGRITLLERVAEVVYAVAGDLLEALAVVEPPGPRHAPARVRV